MALTLKSERQIQAEIIGRLIAQLGINDVNPGSVIDVFTQAVAQQDFALYYQLAQVSRLVDLNALTGDDLDNKAFEYGIFRRQPQKANGKISIFRPVGFTKVSTNFYAGSLAPIAGQTTIDVNDASNVLIGTSGTLILGRPTTNQEEVVYTTAPVNMVNFWRFTLTTPLVNDHAVEETVILKQGVDQPISAGTVVSVPASGTAAEVKFQLDNDEVLLAGELELDNVEITAQQPGSAGNIPIGAIDGTLAFPNPPFVGARATNTSKFTTGRDLEDDDSLRDRIKGAIQAITRAVKEALSNAIVGLVDTETAKRVVSASIVLPIDVVGDVKIYIDDGFGFEPSFASVGFESVIDSATGGEQRLKLAQFPVVKAQLESNNSENYDFSGVPLTLIYQVGTLQETITFTESDFNTPEIAKADEVVAAINNKATLIEARTASGGTFVLITSKADVNENIQIIGGTAQTLLNFPLDAKNTISLYIDDIPKSKDGFTAIIDSGNQAPYDLLAVGAYPHTLTMVVDNKTANPQTATVNAIDVDNTAAVTAQEICNVINRDIAGVVAFTVNGGTKVRIQSLTLLTGTSKIHITGGSANDAVNGLNFSTVEQVGLDGDYVFNRETGELQLKVPLVANQTVTVNSRFTRGKLRAAVPELYTIPNASTLVVSVDGGGNQTVTFDASFTGGGTAQNVAAFINARLNGATAIVRTVGGLNFLEINTNTYITSGSIRIQSSSTSNSVFGFITNTTVSSQKPNKAFMVSTSAGPFDFAQGDTLVTVVDADIVNDTFSILLNYPGTVSTATSTTQFRATNLTTVFQASNVIKDFYLAFTTGLNTDSTGVVASVTLLGGGIARYTYFTNPTNFGNFAAGDLANFANLNDSENNANFVIQAVGGSYVDVKNPVAVATSGEAGTSFLSERRQVLSYNQLNGQVIVTAPFTSAPLVSDQLIVLPSTISNLVYFIGNKKITSFTIKGVVEGVNNNQNLQLSSQADGSDGAIQITGGTANSKLNFNTILYRGIQAYSYWTGLMKLVYKTIYGDDTDLESFPGYGAAGIIFRILAPTVQQIFVEVKVTTANGVTLSSLTNDIKSAITGYVNTLGLGEDVIIERIRAAIIAIPGITDVEVVTPVANVAIADNEKASTSTNNILIG